MVLGYEYSKMKLPQKGFSYPVKKTELDKALENAGVTELKRVFFGTRYSRPELIVIHANLYGEARAGYWMKQEPEVSMYAVPSELRQEVRDLLVKQKILQKITKWLVELESAANVRRDVSQNIWVLFENGKLVLKDKLN